MEEQQNRPKNNVEKSFFLSSRNYTQRDGWRQEVSVASSFPFSDNDEGDDGSSGGGLPAALAGKGEHLFPQGKVL